MAKTTDIKRKDAAALLQKIAMQVAEEIHCPAQPPSRWATKLEKLFKEAGLTIPKPCTGEAHDPAVGGMIDNCGVCMPEWGWVASAIKVK